MLITIILPMIYRVAGVCVLMAQSVLGSGIEQGFQDPKAAGRGNAYVATADHASAVHYNPAGLSLQEGIQSQTMFYGSSLEIDFSGDSGDFSHSQVSPSLAYFFNYAGLMDGDLALGLGLTVPHGLGIEYDEDYPLRTKGYSGYLAHLVVSPAISYRLNDQWSVGGVLNYAHDDYELKQGIATKGDSFVFDGSGSGWGYTLGLMFRPDEKWSFGLTYRSSIRSEIDGTATIDAIIPATFQSEESASTEFNYPSQLILGAAYRIGEKWDVEANLQWSGWSSFDDFTIKKGSGDLVAPFDYKDTLAFGVGATYALTNHSNLHFGYFYSEAAAPEETYNPLIANVDVHTFSVGYDRSFGNWEFGATLLYVNGEPRSVEGGFVQPFSGVSADGKWESSAIIGILGVTRSF